jgi:hypothetical protein
VACTGVGNGIQESNAMKKSIFIFIIALSCTFTIYAQNGEMSNAPQGGNVKIKITINESATQLPLELTATITDSAASRDFISLFPLTLTLEDYNRTEKISNLPKKLSTAGAPPSYAPSVGDICLYVPWGNLCIFYRDFSSSGGLVLLGKIDGGIEAFTGTGSLTAKFEVLK